MIALLIFPTLATLLVWLAGRRDSSRDLRFTTLAIAWVAALPLLGLLPKLPLLPSENSSLALPVTTISSHFWLLTLLWLTGVTLALSRIALAQIGLLRWHHRSQLVGHFQHLELRTLPHLHSPVAAGIFRKTIFLPESWLTWDETTRDAILHHESEHHRHRDPLLRLIASLAVALHWFHPGVHWMARRFALQCEYACDQRVLQSGISPTRYAEILLHFATAHPKSRLGLAMAEHSSLESRIRHLLQRPSRGFIIPAALGLLTCSTGLILTLLGPAPKPAPDSEEIQIRLNANPFPADSP